MEFPISQPKVVRLPWNKLIELQASNVTNGFDLDHNLDLWISKVKRVLDLWPHTWPWPWIFMVKFWNSCISEWEGGLTLHKGGGSRSFMTMTVTIWWPRSGVWIYQIVTGVTSVVGVPSTHLVIIVVVLFRLYVIYDCDISRVYCIITAKYNICHNICAVVTCAIISCNWMMDKWNGSWESEMLQNFHHLWNASEKVGRWPAKVYQGKVSIYRPVANVSWWCHSMKIAPGIASHCKGNLLVTGGFHPLRARNLDIQWFCCYC